MQTNIFRIITDVLSGEQISRRFPVSTTANSNERDDWEDDEERIDEKSNLN